MDTSKSKKFTKYMIKLIISIWFIRIIDGKNINGQNKKEVESNENKNKKQKSQGSQETRAKENC